MLAGIKTNKAGKKLCAMNPYIQAAMAEARHMCTDVIIVCKPERSYASVVCARLQILCPRVKALALARLVFVAQPICVLIMYTGTSSVCAAFLNIDKTLHIYVFA